MPPRKRRPRGLIEELPSGSFRARVYAGVDPLTRKARYLRETHKTYAAAEVALTRLQGQVDEDRHPRGDLTVRQAVTQWLEVVDLADTTRERYEDLIRLHILPVLGDRLADKLDAQVLDRLYARLQQCRDLCDGRRVAGRSPSPNASPQPGSTALSARSATRWTTPWPSR
jgi:integrase